MDPAALKVVVYTRKPKGLVLLGSSAIVRLRPSFRSPMVGDAADVADVARPDLLQAAKYKIVFTRAVIVRSIHSGSGEERRVDHQQPGKVVLANQQVPIEVGLEVWRVKGGGRKSSTLSLSSSE